MNVMPSGQLFMAKQSDGHPTAGEQLEVFLEGAPDGVAIPGARWFVRPLRGGAVEQSDAPRQTWCTVAKRA